jgi:LysM repeat protein
LCLVGLACHVAAFPLSTDVQTGMISDCDILYLVKSTDSCSSIASQNGISLATFYSWNPAVGSSCSMLFPDYYVCVGSSTASMPSPVSTASTVSTTKPVSTTSTPTPIPTSVGSNCNAYYLVKSGDSCNAIAVANNIVLAQFYAWNPTVNNACTNLRIGDSVSAPANPPVISYLFPPLLPST